MKAKVVGKSIFDVIDRDPEIKDNSLLKNCDLKEYIKFNDVTFRYPTSRSLHVQKKDAKTN
jgi:ABC-type bacteriocin/lantibiotic exporter with double-glycine peptidase domain